MQRKVTPTMLDDMKPDPGSVDVVFGPQAREIDLDLPILDGGTQSRAVINVRVVEDYAEAMRLGEVFEPVIVFFDGLKHWVADGFHRILAAKKVDGKRTILADVRQGTQRDAILYSLGANAKHGLQRTDDDKRRAVQRMLDDPEWSRWSTSEIARQCKVAVSTVSRMRAAISVSDKDSVPQTRIVTRGNSTYTMDTSKIGPTAKSNEWSEITWLVYDWAMTIPIAQQRDFTLGEIAQVKDRASRWTRLTDYIARKGIRNATKGEILDGVKNVRDAFKSGVIPQRDPDPGSAIVEPAMIEAPVAVLAETVPDLVVSIEAEPLSSGNGWVGKAKELPVNGKKSDPLVIQVSRMEVMRPADGRKIVTLFDHRNQRIMVEFLPEQASYLAGELLQD